MPQHGWIHQACVRVDSTQGRGSNSRPKGRAMDLRFGIEEEFFVVCADTQVLIPHAHDDFLARAKHLSGGAVHRELLQSQVEAATPVCDTLADARRHLQRSRTALEEAGRSYGLAVLAAGTH